MKVAARYWKTKKWLGFLLFFLALLLLISFEVEPLKSGDLVLGDLDCDTLVTLNDIVLEANKVFLGEPFAAPAVAGEVNCDARFSASDVVLLLNKVFLQSSFPCSLDCYNIFFGDTCKFFPRIIDEHAAWSPDGQTIAYYHRGSVSPDAYGIYLIDTSGNNRRLLVPGVFVGHPAFSPNGQWLAFANLTDNSIYKIKLNGDSLTRLTFNGFKDQAPDWSPDGESLLYVRIAGGDTVRGVRIVSKDGQNDRQVLFAASYPNWSMEGNRILCRAPIFEVSQYNPYIGIFSLTDSSFKKLRPLSATDDWRYLRWSPDNSKILITVLESTVPCFNGGSFVYVMDFTGQSFQKQISTLSWEGTWSPDGSKIIYTDSRPEFGTLFIMNADGSNKKQLTFKQN